MLEVLAELWPQPSCPLYLQAAVFPPAPRNGSWKEAAKPPPMFSPPQANINPERRVGAGGGGYTRCEDEAPALRLVRAGSRDCPCSSCPRPLLPPTGCPLFSRSSLKRSLRSRSWMTASLEPWISSSEAILAGLLAFLGSPLRESTQQRQGQGLVQQAHPAQYWGARAGCPPWAHTPPAGCGPVTQTQPLAHAGVSWGEMNTEVEEAAATCGTVCMQTWVSATTGCDFGHQP